MDTEYRECLEEFSKHHMTHGGEPDNFLRIRILVDRARWTPRGRAPSGILAPIRGRR